MHLVIRDVKGVFFDGFVKEVILPGEDGELSIWDFHQTLVSCLREGDIILGFDKDMPRKSVHINAGVAKFERSELAIMCL